MRSEENPYAGRAGRQWWLVIALTIAAIVAVIDRSILSLLADPIKRDLGLSDTQLGLIFGTSFALANVLFTLPAGYLADRISRRGLISLGCLVWSGMTAVCGVAGSFWQLLWSRAGVGFSEGVIHPSSFSMLRGALAPERRGRGFAVYGMSLLVGSALGFLLGAILLHAYATHPVAHWPLIGPWLAGLSPWRLVLLTLGVLGLPFTLLLITVIEPHRDATALAAREVSIGAAVRYMREHWTVYLPILAFSACSSMKANAFGAFIASIPQRRWDIPAAQVGRTLGVLMLIATPVGMWIMGVIVDRLTKRHGPRGAVMVGAASVVLGLIFSSSAPIAPSATAFYALATGDFFVGGGAFAVAGMIIAMITPAVNMGKTSAVQLFVYGIVGMGIGPAVVGVVSDRFFPGKEGIAMALSLSNGTFMLASLICISVLLVTIRSKQVVAA
jgi:MFS family permease